MPRSISGEIRMFFTWMGQLGAWLAFIVGLMRMGMAFYVISIDEKEAAAFYTARYFGTKTVGQVIDQSFVVITLAVAMGILAEISRNVRRRAERRE